MLKEERYDKILEIINEEVYTSAQNLSKRLFVSLPTIRRDLAELQKRNLILRSHGGAKKIDTDHTVLPLDFRKTVNYTEKRRLCERAAKFIKDNDIIFIDASSTTIQMVDFIADKRAITVVTNSLALSVELHKKHIKSFCTGGELLNHSLGYAGDYAEEFVKNFNFDVTFFSCRGINSSQMIVDASLPETSLRRRVLDLSDKAVFLCDHSKFGVRAPYNLMSANDVDYIITEKKSDLSILENLDKAKIIVI